MNIKFTRAFVLGLITFTTVARGTLLKDLESAFQVSRIPNQKELVGTWAGRCSDLSNPDQPMAGLFVFKLIPDETVFPPERPTMSYFQASNAPSNLFDSMKAAEALNYTPAKNWFANEQWRRAVVLGGSMTNWYLMDGGVEMERAVRIFEDEFEDRLMLRVTRIEGGQSTVQRYCYFTKKLGAQVTPPVPPTNESVMGIIDVVGLHQSFTVMNKFPQEAFRWVEVRNVGVNSIDIQQYRTLLFNGNIVEEQLPYVLLPGHAMRHTISTGQKYFFRAVQFYATGSSRLQVSVIRNP